MATINGAKALGLDAVTGSLTPGKRADIILIRTNDINVAPMANIETTVVQSATPANVDTVLADGRIVKRHGKLVAYDVEKVVRGRQGVVACASAAPPEACWRRRLRVGDGYPRAATNSTVIIRLLFSPGTWRTPVRDIPDTGWAVKSILAITRAPKQI